MGLLHALSCSMSLLLRVQDPKYPTPTPCCQWGVPRSRPARADVPNENLLLPGSSPIAGVRPAAGSCAGASVLGMSERVPPQTTGASPNHSSQIQGPGPTARTGTGGWRLGRARDLEEQSQVLAGSF